MRKSGELPPGLVGSLSPFTALPWNHDSDDIHMSEAFPTGQTSFPLEMSPRAAYRSKWLARAGPHVWGQQEWCWLLLIYQLRTWGAGKGHIWAEGTLSGEGHTDLSPQSNIGLGEFTTVLGLAPILLPQVQEPFGLKMLSHPNKTH